MCQILDFMHSLQDILQHNPAYSLVHPICSIGWTHNSTDSSICEAALQDEVSKIRISPTCVNRIFILHLQLPLSLAYIRAATWPPGEGTIDKNVTHGKELPFLILCKNLNSGNPSGLLFTNL